MADVRDDDNGGARDWWTPIPWFGYASPEKPSKLIGVVDVDLLNAQICGYTESEEHDYRIILRGDEVRRTCLNHICQGMTGCPNAALPPGKGWPYCARPECQKWGATPFKPAPMNFDVWVHILANMDRHELAYLRDIDWGMRDVINNLCTVRHIEQVELAPTWIGAARNMERMQDLIKIRPIPRMQSNPGTNIKIDDRPYQAALASPAPGVLQLVFDNGDCSPVDVFETAAYVVKHAGNTDAIGCVIKEQLKYAEKLQYGKGDNPMSVYRFGLAALPADRADVIAYLYQEHDWLKVMLYQSGSWDHAWAFYRNALENGRFRVAAWMRDNVYDDIVGDVTTDVCSKLLRRMNDDDEKMLKWLHIGVTEHKMPCYGTCAWWRHNKQ